MTHATLVCSPHLLLEKILKFQSELSDDKDVILFTFPAHELPELFTYS